MNRDVPLEPVVGMEMSALGVAEERRSPVVPLERPSGQLGGAPELVDPWLLWFAQTLIALGGLVLLSPVILLVTIAVKLTSPGPVFYRGERVGQGMREFVIYKFRTLRIGSESEIGARLLSPKDSFYTPIGRFLKRSKLDEIPQLWNVVRGDMNFVGPRPVRPIFLREFLASIPGYARRFRVKPGITGLAQLRGGYFTTPAAKLRYELRYIQRRGVALDLAILALTFLKLLNRWITLGGLLFVLFMFVSFMPDGLLNDFYIYAFGVRASVVHIAIAIIGSWLVIRRRGGDARLTFYRTPMTWPMLFFLAAALVSAALSPYRYQATRGALYYGVTGFLISSAIVNGTFTRNFIERAAQVVALSALGISVVGIVELAATVGPQASTLVAEWLAGPGITATLGTPVVLATYLVLGVPLLLYQLVVAEEGPRRDFWMAGSTVALIGILLTKSPVGLVALSVSSLLVLWRLFPRALLPCAIVLGPFMYVAVGPTLAEWRLDLCGPDRTLCGFLGAATWSQFLFGIGARTLGEYSLPAGTIDPEKVGTHVRLLVENGLVGWGGLVWVLLTALTSLWRAQRDLRDQRLRALLWAVFCSVVGFTITLPSFSAFENLTLQVFFWGVLGLGVGAAVRLGVRRHEYAVVVKLGH